jgi:hypothetical protein
MSQLHSQTDILYINFISQSNQSALLALFFGINQKLRDEGAI